MRKLQPKTETRRSKGAIAAESANSGGVPFALPFNGQTMQELISIQQRNAEMLGKLNDLVVKAVETITTQQVAAAKALTDQFAIGNGSLFGSRAPEEWGAAQADFLRSWIDTWFAQTQAIAETGSRCCVDAAGIMGKRCAEAAAEAKSIVSGEGAGK